MAISFTWAHCEISKAKISLVNLVLHDLCFLVLGLLKTRSSRPIVNQMVPDTKFNFLASNGLPFLFLFKYRRVFINTVTI